jgi:hypothetical protein
MPQAPLHRIAYARSGDKGSSCNIGVIAYTTAGYDLLFKQLTASKVAAFFEALGPCEAIRYELPNLGAFNFVLKGILAGGGSQSLRLDSQGKALGQALLEMELDIPLALIEEAKDELVSSP